MGEMTSEGSTSVLRNRNFMILWGGNALSLLGSSAVRISYPVLILLVSGSPATAGWMSVAVGLPLLLFQVPAGLVADYVNRRRTMLVCQAVGLAATVSAALALLLHLRGGTALLFLAAFLESAAFAFFGLAEFGAVRDVVGEGQRATAYSFYEAEQPVSTMVGRTFGGGLLAIGRAVPFLANAVSYGICLVALSVLPGRAMDAKPREQTGSWRQDVAEGFRWAWSVVFIRVTALITAATNALFQGMVLLFIVVLTEQRQSSWAIGAVLAASGAGGVLGSFAAPWLLRRVAADVVYGACLCGWSAVLLAVALVPNPFVYAVAWAGVGGFGAISSVAMTVIRLRTVPEAALGRMLGAVSIVTDGSGPLGAAVIGYALSAWGGHTTGWVLAGLMFAITVVGVFVVRSSREPLTRFTAG